MNGALDGILDVHGGLGGSCAGPFSRPLPVPTLVAIDIHDATSRP